MTKPRFGRTTWLLIFIFLTFVQAAADERTDRVDEIFEMFDSTHTPGAAVLVLRDDEVLYKQAYGMASLELGVPNTTETVFRLGSVSKMFTGAAIALLAEEGRISLDDSVTKYFPELPEEVYGPVKVRHMIHHTSGIRDSEALYPVLGMEYSQWYTHGMFLDMLARQKSLDFRPGDRFEYSNSGYTLLALIVERISQMPFAEFVGKRIFEPLGMERSAIQTDHQTFIPDRAAGYAPSESGYVNWMTNNQLVGHDAVYSSVEDMSFWARALIKGTLGRAVVERMITRASFNDGSVNDYAFGILVEDYKGLKTWAHAGWFVGYLAHMVIFPDQKFSVVCLSNVTQGSPQKACYRIADIYLEEELERSLAELRERKKKPDPRTVDALAGDYVGIDYGDVLSLEIQDGLPKGKGAPWTFEPSPYGEWDFINYDRSLKMRIVSNGPGSGGIKFEVATPFLGLMRFEKFEKMSLSEEELSEYPGDYVSEEIGARAKITPGENGLKFEVGRLSAELLPLSPDRFSAAPGMVTFERDAEGRVTGFGLSQYGFRNLLFQKTNDR